MNILGIIPARGGSKGLRSKNIRLLDGKPLICYTIEQAQNSKHLDKIIVSTDDSKIAKISKSKGAQVPFKRPKTISGDSATIIDVVRHSLDFLTSQSYDPEIIVCLQPTSPLRTTKMIDKSIQMLKNSNSTSVVSVSTVKTHPYTSFWLKNNYLTSFRKDFKKNSNRQERSTLYHATGAIYTFWSSNIRKFNSIYGNKIKPIIISKPEENIDIDSNFDLFICEMILKHWNKFQKS